MAYAGGGPTGGSGSDYGGRGGYGGGGYAGGGPTGGSGSDYGGASSATGGVGAGFAGNPGGYGGGYAGGGPTGGSGSDYGGRSEGGGVGAGFAGNPAGYGDILGALAGLLGAAGMGGSTGGGGWGRESGQFGGYSTMGVEAGVPSTVGTPGSTHAMNNPPGAISQKDQSRIAPEVGFRAQKDQSRISPGPQFSDRSTNPNSSPSTRGALGGRATPAGTPAATAPSVGSRSQTVSNDVFGIPRADVEAAIDGVFNGLNRMGDMARSARLVGERRGREGGETRAMAPAAPAAYQTDRGK